MAVTYDSQANASLKKDSTSLYALKVSRLGWAGPHQTPPPRPLLLRDENDTVSTKSYRAKTRKSWWSEVETGGSL